MKELLGRNNEVITEKDFKNTILYSYYHGKRLYNLLNGLELHPCCFNDYSQNHTENALKINKNIYTFLNLKEDIVVQKFLNLDVLDNDISFKIDTYLEISTQDKNFRELFDKDYKNVENILILEEEITCAKLVSIINLHKDNDIIIDEFYINFSHYLSSEINYDNNYETVKIQCNNEIEFEFSNIKDEFSLKIKTKSKELNINSIEDFMNTIFFKESMKNALSNKSISIQKINNGYIYNDTYYKDIESIFDIFNKNK